jgi:hypothetical protein
MIWMSMKVVLLRCDADEDAVGAKDGGVNIWKRGYSQKMPWRDLHL